MTDCYGTSGTCDTCVRCMVKTIRGEFKRALAT